MKAVLDECLNSPGEINVASENKCQAWPTISPPTGFGFGSPCSPGLPIYFFYLPSITFASSLFQLLDPLSLFSFCYLSLRASSNPSPLYFCPLICFFLFFPFSLLSPTAQPFNIEVLTVSMNLWLWAAVVTAVATKRSFNHTETSFFNLPMARLPLPFFAILLELYIPLMRN